MERPAINPNSVYSTSDLKEMLGNGCLAVLREYGLRAIGDRYLGSMVIECFYRAWKVKGGEDQQPEATPSSIKPMSKLRPASTIPAKPQVPSLAEQLEQSRRMLQEDKAKAKSKKNQ